MSLCRKGQMTSKRSQSCWSVNERNSFFSNSIVHLACTTYWSRYVNWKGKLLVDNIDQTYFSKRKTFHINLIYLEDQWKTTNHCFFLLLMRVVFDHPLRSTCQIQWQWHLEQFQIQWKSSFGFEMNQNRKAVCLIESMHISRSSSSFFLRFHSNLSLDNVIYYRLYIINYSYCISLIFFACHSRERSTSFFPWSPERRANGNF